MLMRESQTLSDILDESAVADDYHIPGRTLSQWRYLGRGPRYMKVGRLVRYRRSDVETWLDANTVTPGMPPDAT